MDSLTFCFFNKWFCKAAKVDTHCVKFLATARFSAEPPSITQWVNVAISQDVLLRNVSYWNHLELIGGCYSGIIFYRFLEKPWKRKTWTLIRKHVSINYHFPKLQGWVPRFCPFGAERKSLQTQCSQYSKSQPEFCTRNVPPGKDRESHAWRSSLIKGTNHSPFRWKYYTVVPQTLFCLFLHTHIQVP